MKKNPLYAYIFVGCMLAITLTVFSPVIPIGPANYGDDGNSSVDNNGTTPNAPNSAAINAWGEWWDTDWTYRVGINVTAQTGVNYTDRLVHVYLNFTDLVLEEGELGTFDENSLRVIEYDASGNIIAEVPSQLVKADGYNKSSNAVGYVYWVLNGTTPGGSTRYYFIYFDVEENGLKPAPNYNTGLSVTENLAGKDYTVENNKIRISMAEGSPPNGGSYYDHIYEVYNKITGYDEQRSSTHWGWMLYAWYYGGVSTTFNGVTDLVVVANGPVVAIVKMIWDDTNFLYERYYTINYIDNTVKITHKVTAKTALSSGTWYFASWWNPGRGDNSYTAPNSSYGIGGYSFPVPHPTLGSEFTAEDELYPDVFNGWLTATLAMQQEAWFVQWDDDKNEGVGTVWTNGSSVSAIGYRSGTAQEGRNVYLRFNPPAITANTWFEFNVWGIVFNGYDGDYVKARADGLQNTPTITVGQLQNSGKLLYFHIDDVDGQPIYNATVELYNSTSMTPIDTAVTDTNGNVTFRGLYNDTFTIVTKYWIGTKLFTINVTSYTINQTVFERYNFVSVVGNLTTAEFYAKDSAITDPQYEALYNAKLTIVNITDLTDIAVEYTDVSGWATFRIPTGEYNITVEYQGKPRSFTMNISTTPLWPTQNFTINGHLYAELSVSVTENKTDISIVKTEYGKQADGWPHDESINAVPYYISLYRNDTVNITFYYENVKGTVYGIAGADTKIWELRRKSDQLLVDNGTLIEPGGAGNYSLVLDTTKTAYAPDTYVLFVNITEPNYQSGIIYVEINILNHTSKLTYLSDNSSDTVYWGEMLNIKVKYAALLPIPYNITGADVSYYIADNTSINGSLSDNGDGIYSLSLNSSLFNVGKYTLVITAVKGNITEQSITVLLEIMPIPTNVSWTIPNEYRVSNLYMKVAIGEMVIFTVNYTENGKYIPNAVVTVSINIDEDHMDILEATDLGNGLYRFEFNSSNYIVSQSQLTVVCYEEHHEQQTFFFDLAILDFWNTQIELVEPPSFYPWSNNASYVFKYFCNEEPRNGWTLPDSTISQLNITVRSAGNYITKILFGKNELGTKWGYTDLKNDPNYGPGYYRVWFSTDVLNISGIEVFYAIPTISRTYYRAAEFKPYVWVRPPYTTLWVAAEGYNTRMVEKVSLYIHQSITFTLTYNVTDTMSVLYGKMLAGAHVTYTIYNFEDPTDILMSGTVNAADTDGVYEITIPAIKLGDYKINFTASLGNYSTASASVLFSANKRPINVELGENLVGRVASTPQNRKLTVEINLTDPVSGTPLEGANVTFVFNGKVYQFMPTSTPGIYSFTFTEDMMAQVEADRSYSLTVKVSKENYTDYDLVITLDVGLPVDPYFGVPYRYWTIGFTTIGGAVFVYASAKGIQYSRIPLVIKQINSTIKAIKKRKKIPEGRLRPTRDERVAEELAPLWEKIGLKYPHTGKKGGEGYTEPETGETSSEAGDISSEIRKKKEGGSD